MVGKFRRKTDCEIGKKSTKTKGNGLSQVVEIRKSKPVILSAADQLLSKSTTRFFIVRFFAVTAALFLVGFLISSTISVPGVRTALYYGMAFPAIASFISFLISEWAFEQSTGIFLGVSVGTVYRRFADKEALVAAVYENHYAENYARRGRRLLSAQGLKTLRDAARFVVYDLVQRTREQAPFLRCYWIAMQPANPALRKRIDRANMAGFE